MTARAGQRAQFLANAGWGMAQMQPLAGDASARRYFRVISPQGARAVLMDTPKDCPDDPAQFLYIADHLAALGLSPPRCLAQDLGRGFLLLEDLGDALFARILAQDPAQEWPLYSAAVDVLLAIQSHPAPPGLPDNTAQDWAGAAMLAVSHYAAAVLGHSPDESPLCAALAGAIQTHADGPRVLILRDYHAENLLHLPERAGPAQVGLLDFQLGQMGQPCYDLVSLLQDARRDVPPVVQAGLMAAFAEKTGADSHHFAASYACFGAQRALRILGIFAQLCTNKGKPAYVDLIPRVWSHLQANLAHPALADLARTCAQTLPPPSPAALNKLRSQCCNIP